MIESIAAIVMLTIAVPPVVWALSEGHAQRIDTLMTSRARWLAAEKLEDVIADRHSTTRGYDYLIAANYPAEAGLAGFPGFSRTVAFSETEPDLTTPGSGYMLVTVTVSWTDGKGKPTSTDVSTVLTEY